ALRGEVWTKGFTYLRQAGTKAMSRSAYREAAAWFEQALVALARHPHDTVSMAQAVDVRLELRHALDALGELGREVEMPSRGRSPGREPRRPASCGLGRGLHGRVLQERARL